MTKLQFNQWPWELIMLTFLFTLSGMCFILMILTPSLPPPYYVMFNALWGTAGAILLAVGIYLTYRLKTFIQALLHQEPPDYHQLNRTFLIFFLILLLMLLAANLSCLFVIGGPPIPPPPPSIFYGSAIKPPPL
ncbi:MAG: hypothetical protein ACFFCH_11830 [Promethearchaeota archaeon]